MQEEREQFKDDLDEEGGSTEPERENFAEEANQEYERYQEMMLEEEEFEKSLPSDAEELFRLRDETTEKMDTNYNAGNKEMGRRLQNRIHAINRKLNELGVEEREQK